VTSRDHSHARTVEAARRHFDRWAGRYEDDPVSRWLAELQREAMAALALGSADRFLDVGCGTGVAVRAAAATVSRAVGVDVSPQMIREARARSDGLANVAFVEGESGALPFDDGTFTALLCSTAFHHYPDPERAVREMARVLAPGGRIVIGDGSTDAPLARVLDLALRTFEHGHVRLYRSEELARFLYRAGFSAAARRSLLRGGYMIVRARKG